MLGVLRFNPRSVLSHGATSTPMAGSSKAWKFQSALRAFARSDPGSWRVEQRGNPFQSALRAFARSDTEVKADYEQNQSFNPRSVLSHGATGADKERRRSFAVSIRAPCFRTERPP